MNFRDQRLSLREAKELDFVNYLSPLGHEPTEIRIQDLRYSCPLREENSPSFKINRRLNRRYDHGMGKGGNQINILTVTEYPKRFADSFTFQQLSAPPSKPSHKKITLLATLQ